MNKLEIVRTTCVVIMIGLQTVMLLHIFGVF